MLAKANFLSIQADGSTDAGNVEDELFLVLYFDPHSEDRKVHVRNQFLAVLRPKSANAEGLFECCTRALDFVGVANWESKLVGFGCDGASVNVAAGGLRGYLERAVPGVVVFWCLAHRLELSLKDALKGTLFTAVDDMLMRVFYLYEKSPKKYRDLDDIVSELKACLEPADMPSSGTNRPLRACGTRFVAHKVAALERLINRLGAYLSHLAILSEDHAVRSTDRQKLKGYLLQWRKAKMLYGCALFHDLMKPAAVLCKALQDDEVCVIGAIEAVLKTSTALEKLAATPFDDLSTVKKVTSRIEHCEGTSITYQGAELTNHDQGIDYVKSHKDEYLANIQSCLKSRVKAQSIELLTHTLTILAPKGWEKTNDASFGYEALRHLSTRFSAHLEKAKVDCSALEEEWDDLIDYAKRYLNLVQDEYQVIWWKLFNGVDAKKWSNLLTLVELLFCLPMSNGRVERAFSQLKLIKTERRTCLGEGRLDSLVRIAVDAPPLAKWNASGAVQRWWTDKKRRQGKDIRAPAKPTTHATTSETIEDQFALSLEDWETWLE